MQVTISQFNNYDNMNTKNKIILSLAIFATVLIAGSCSTKKNTATTRTFHNVTSYYNVYFNGYESYKAGKKRVNDEYRDNFSQILPIYKYSKPEATAIAAGDMDFALQKAGKAITKHSITVKPKLKNRRNGLSEKDKEFMKKNEYCKWIDDSYLLMGKANFYKQDYDRSIRSFRRIINLYKNENTRFEATLWLVKTYIEQKKYKDAHKYLTELENDVRHPKKLDKDINLTFADMHIRQGEYKKAIVRLEKGIELTRRKKERARYIFILAQLNYELGNMQESSDLYKKVIKMNPNYDMVFNAKINRATAFTGGDSKDIKKQLRRMLRDDKNTDYKDQIYYALANIEYAENNEPKAIEYYKLSAQTSVSNDNQKALSFLALADIYFAKPKYLIAGDYYDSTMQYLSQDYTHYDKVNKKASNLSELVMHLREVQNQDSLQMVASWDETKRNKFINDLIQQVIEEERLAKLREEEMYNQTFDDNNNFNNNNNNGSQGGKWYMYNPALVSRGQNEFKKKWGTRKLEDNWRRSNKSANNMDNPDDEEVVDSTRITDNKTPEFYLQDLPLTDSAMQASNLKILESLLGAAEVYEEKLRDFPAAIKTYEDMNARFPDNVYELESFYRLYKLCELTQNQPRADYYKNQIINQYPNSKYAKILQDPNYILQLKAIEQQAINMYQATLKKYNDALYNEVIADANTGTKQYPDSETYPHFLFLKGKAYGSLGKMDSLYTIMKTVSEEYASYEVAELAAEIVALVESGKFNTDIYEADTLANHFYVLMVNKKQNITELNFKLKNHAADFSNQRTFLTEIKTLNPTFKLIVVKSFTGKQEGLQFFNSIVTNFVLQDLPPDQYEHFIITEKNLNTFLEDKIFEKYMKFYAEIYK